MDGWVVDGWVVDGWVEFQTGIFCFQKDVGKLGRRKGFAKASVPLAYFWEKKPKSLRMWLRYQGGIRQ